MMHDDTKKADAAKAPMPLDAGDKGQRSGSGADTAFQAMVKKRQQNGAAEAPDLASTLKGSSGQPSGSPWLAER